MGHTVARSSSLSFIEPPATVTAAASPCNSFATFPQTVPLHCWFQWKVYNCQAFVPLKSGVYLLCTVESELSTQYCIQTTWQTYQQCKAYKNKATIAHHFEIITVLACWACHYFHVRFKFTLCLRSVAKRIFQLRSSGSIIWLLSFQIQMGVSCMHPVCVFDLMLVFGRLEPWRGKTRAPPFTPFLVDADSDKHSILLHSVLSQNCRSQHWKQSWLAWTTFRVSTKLHLPAETSTFSGNYNNNI